MCKLKVRYRKFNFGLHHCQKRREFTKRELCFGYLIIEMDYQETHGAWKAVEQFLSLAIKSLLVLTSIHKKHTCHHHLPK